MYPVRAPPHEVASQLNNSLS
jgi:16S rRNA C1402 N4-methylase RsmH